MVVVAVVVIMITTTPRETTIHKNTTPRQKVEEKDPGNMMLIKGIPIIVPKQIRTMTMEGVGAANIIKGIVRRTGEAVEEAIMIEPHRGML